MNTVLHFPRGVSYPDLDITMLRQAHTNAGTASIEVKRLFTQTNYLPSLHSRVSDVSKALVSADLKLRETVQTVFISLTNDSETIKGYLKDLEDVSDAEREEVFEDIANRLEDALKAVAAQEVTLTNVMSTLAASVDRTATQGYIKQLEADEARLPAEVQEIKARQDILEEKRKALTDAMALIEAKGFSEIAKETALTAQELAKLGMSMPEMAAIEGAIELAKQILEKVENLINYLGLAEARDTIRNEIDTLIATTHGKTEELRLVSLRKNLIGACHEFDDHRAQYMAEFEKFILAKRSFLTTYREVAGDDHAAVNQFMVDALALAKHLKVI